MHDDAPSTALYEPTLHGEHAALAATCPALVPWVPAGHAEGHALSSEVLPVALPYRPVGQGVHEPEPGRAANDPGSQSKQPVVAFWPKPPGPRVPAGHSVQLGGMPYVPVRQPLEQAGRKRTPDSRMGQPCGGGMHPEVKLASHVPAAHARNSFHRSFVTSVLSSSAVSE